MAFNIGALAPLLGLQQGAMQGQDQVYKEALRRLALQQAQQEQQALGLIGKTLPQIGQQDPGAGIPQQQMPGGIQQLPQVPNATAAMGAAGSPTDFTGKSSWFGNSPGWNDPSDSGLQAGGQPVSAGPGIALRIPASSPDFGKKYDVTAPNGQTQVLQQTDYGPAKWTGRTNDINSPAAAGFGYTPQSFPTDQQFIIKAHRQLDANLDGAATKLIQQGLPGPAVQDSTKAAMLAGREIDPVQWGRATRNDLIKAIDKADPSAPDPVKALAFLQLNKILAPEEKIQSQIWAKENQQAIQLGLANIRATTAERGQDEATRREIMREEFRLSQAGGAGGSRGLNSSKMIEYTDKDGNPQQQLVREQRGQAGFVDSVTGQPWKPPEGATNLKEVTAGTAGGGRAGAQIGRQVIAGTEVSADLQNIKDMPVGTTTGLFGSVNPGPSLTGALKGDLARHLTKEDETNLKMAMAGIGRELSTLMSPVYSGNWASEQLAPLIPQAGNTIPNALYGIARIKQSAVNALRGLDASPLLGAEQKKLAKDLKGEMENAIPWDVKDVNAWIRDNNPKESFGDYVKRSGVQGAAGRAERGEPVRPGSAGAAPDIQQLQRQLAPENWSKLTPEQQADVARQVEELEKAGGARGN